MQEANLVVGDLRDLCDDFSSDEMAPSRLSAKRKNALGPGSCAGLGRHSPRPDRSSRRNQVPYEQGGSSEAAERSAAIRHERKARSTGHGHVDRRRDGYETRVRFANERLWGRWRDECDVVAVPLTRCAPPAEPGLASRVRSLGLVGG